jgi:uncharacterized protein YbbK (DUF523 family)
MEKTYDAVVSACLAGIPCRYDGRARKNGYVAGLVENGKAVAACPESMGGLKSPRSAAEIRGGDGWDVLSGAARVYNKDGEELTDVFLTGAQRFMDFVQKMNAKSVILKSKSPSCGVNGIYDGSFSGTLKKGCGVTCALLQKNGMNVLEMDGQEER